MASRQHDSATIDLRRWTCRLRFRHFKRKTFQKNSSASRTESGHNSGRNFGMTSAANPFHSH
jgi:hypothetical protein